MDPPFSSRPTDLVHLPETVARERFFDAHDYRWLKVWALAFSAVAVGYALWLVAGGSWGRLWLPVAQLLLSRAPFWAAEREVVPLRTVLLAYLVLQLGLVPFYLPTFALGVRTLGFAAPLALLPFVFPVPATVALYSLPWLANLAFELAPGAKAATRLPLPALIAQAVVAGVALFLNRSYNQASARSFLRSFQVESSRQRDRERMRDELDYARRIQLGMLPRSDPRPEGLEVTGISLPATEVGGDYYEYFASQASRFTLVIGDVAGHGVASGLLLSGIRSCLHLLQDEDPRPREILERLDRMVTATTDRRMFITLLYATFDLELRRLTVASAGHPPVLYLAAASGAVEEIGGPAPPLGTRLGASFHETTLDFAAGDMMTFYTDGLTELRSDGEHSYGLDRLLRLLRQNAHKSSREVREAVLADLWNFKGDAEQVDDLTLVVVKARETSDASHRSPTEGEPEKANGPPGALQRRKTR